MRAISHGIRQPSSAQDLRGLRASRPGNFWINVAVTSYSASEYLNWLASHQYVKPRGVIGRAGFHSGITGDARHDDLYNDHVPENHEAPARGGANLSAIAR